MSQESVYSIIRKTGYCTSGQASEIARDIEKAFPKRTVEFIRIEADGTAKVYYSDKTFEEVHKKSVYSN